MPLHHTPAELAAWLRLSQEPKLGVLAYTLLSGIGLPEDIYALRAPALRAHLPDDLARQLAAPAGPEISASIEAAMAWVAQDNHHILTLSDPHYPKQLLTIADPPLLLYVSGNPATLSRAALAVVGARSASQAGAENAHAFARFLSAAGWCVVSGLAEGIDAAAHEGALSAGLQGGGTVAVIGCGIDIVYPAHHANLSERIARHGALVSEYPLGQTPRRHHFPQRNRLVAGLARGVLVVEAARNSGSLITARLAAESGREVFAIPGSIHSPLARGCHALIRQGAKLVETAQDITDELAVLPLAAGHGAPKTAKAAIQRAQAYSRRSTAAANRDNEAMANRGGNAVLPLLSTTGFSDESRFVLNALGYDPVDIDTLYARTSLPVSKLNTLLLEWELGGIVERLPGGRFQRLGGST
jgi:DNA processing protein